ncbi:MAG: hypothetical protein IPN44_10790 [Flavobacteriales bacterium]|nr:hypothetical protein [Flavobacteriales bacterium]
MKLKILLLSVLASGNLAQAQDQTYADCLVKASSSWGQPCSKCENYKGFQRDYSEVYQVELKNSCTEMMEVKLAMQEENGNWRTFPVKALQGGETMYAYACHGTGKYLFWARRMNDTQIVLPTDGEIVSAYRGK